MKIIFSMLNTIKIPKLTNKIINGISMVSVVVNCNNRAVVEFYELYSIKPTPIKVMRDAASKTEPKLIKETGHKVAGYNTFMPIITPIPITYPIE